MCEMDTWDNEPNIKEEINTNNVHSCNLTCFFHEWQKWELLPSSLMHEQQTKTLKLSIIETDIKLKYKTSP